ncbi:PrpR N-terminal domain-containing protein [Blautia schinkii]|nr:PrpR N-terminal domain-containing protein [Blautia schinkii]
MRKIKILAIAPYEGMAETILAIAQQREDLDVTVRVGNLSTGLQIAKTLEHQNYDVILSRGGTADLIRSSGEIPVVETAISVYDVLRAIKMAENYSDKMAIAGFPSITNCAKLLCDLLQYKIDIFTFEKTEDAYSTLSRLKKQGYGLIICDMIGSTTAAQLGMNSILISSGTESIETALNEAVKLVKSSQRIYKQKELFQTILTDREEDFLIYDPDGKLWYSTVDDLAQENFRAALADTMEEHLQDFLKQPYFRLDIKYSRTILNLSNHHVYYEEQKYTIITITKKQALFSDTDNSIAIFNKPAADPEDFRNYYNSAIYIGKTRSFIEDYAATTFPVLILGEVGTGKDKAASLIYEQGPYQNGPYYMINCGLLNEKRWAALLDNDNSPLNTVHTTIHLKGMEKLNNTQLDRLFSYFEQSNVLKRNRLIFSYVETPGVNAMNSPVCSYLTNQLNCLTLHLEPLRSRKDDIPSISALYLNQLNASLGKQIIGFEADALVAIQNFPWNHNLDQFHRILKELAVITKSSYITKESVTDILKKEQPAHPWQVQKQIPFNLDRTLDEINYDIIRTVLEQENMSKEKTAKRLGISRSTLWRILKSRDGSQ